MFLPEVIHVFLADAGAWASNDLFAFPALSERGPIFPAFVRMWSLAPMTLKPQKCMVEIKAKNKEEIINIFHHSKLSAHSHGNKNDVGSKILKVLSNNGQKKNST